MGPNIGDYVLVHPVDTVRKERDSTDPLGYRAGWESTMEKLIGKVCKVVEITSINYGIKSGWDGHVFVRLKASKFSGKLFPECCGLDQYYFCLDHLELLPHFEDLDSGT